MESFFFLQRCKNNNCNVYQHFTILLNSYNEKGKFILNETEQKLFSFKCNKCRMITFVDFEKIANEVYITLLKERRKKYFKLE